MSPDTLVLLLDALAAQLEGARRKPSGGYLARCPLHDDDRASLSLDLSDDGKLLVKCFAGCDQVALLKRLTPTNGNGHTPQLEQATEFSYYDEVGELLYQVVRGDGKRFLQRRPDGQGQWAWHLGPCHKKCREHAKLDQPVRRVLYNLPDVLDAARQGGTVWVVEGEKDAESVGRAGEVATTSGNASSWRDEYADYLKGARVVVCPDNDEAGEGYAKAIATSLENRGVNFKVVEVPPPHKDISDYLGAGGSLTALTALQPVVAPADDAPTLVVPTLDPDALYGPAGEWVRAMEGLTEAPAAALLLSVLTGFGAAVGPGAEVMVAPGEHHGPRLFTCIVGKSGSRKGTAWNVARDLMNVVDPHFMAVRGGTSGFGSGEAFIDAIRNPEGKNADEDDGDRRLLVVDTEMGSTVRTIERQGSNLGHQLRKAWDGTPLQTHSRGHGSQVLHQHFVSMLGHITPHDLATVKIEDLMNGFAGRFLFAYVVPGPEIEDEDAEDAGMSPREIQQYARPFTAALERARSNRVLRRDPGAKELYKPWYREMRRRDYDEPIDALMARAPNHVMRLALIYALLDQSPAIRAEHMRAAFALWRYCEASIYLLFGPRGLIASARRRINSAEADLGIVYKALQAAGPDGLTMEQIAGILGGAPMPLVAAQVAELQNRDMARQRRSESRKCIVWVSKEASRARRPS